MTTTELVLVVIATELVALKSILATLVLTTIFFRRNSATDTLVELATKLSDYSPPADADDTRVTIPDGDEEITPSEYPTLRSNRDWGAA